MAAPRWKFWIDVGGTFTDCLAKCPDGSIHRHKLLSSGATKGRTAESSTQNVIVDSARRRDPADFWIGWQLAIFDEAGNSVDSAIVTGFDVAAGSLSLSGLRQSPADGTAYELRCHEEAPVVAIR